MAKKRKFADGGVMTGTEAKKLGADAGKAAKTTSLRKYLVGQMDAVAKQKARMDTLDKGGWRALDKLDSQIADLDATAKSEREKFTDSMGSYKKGGTVKSRGDGIAQRGKTRGRFV